MPYSKEFAGYIPDGVANQAIKKWHEEHNPERIQTIASPSTLTECPRVVWLRKHNVPLTNPMKWGLKQRLLLGRILENQIAEQFKASGILLYHWKDDVAGESVKFGLGEGRDRLEGTPDLLLQYGDKVAISDAKTSRGDSFAYVPIDPDEIFEDYLWYKYKLQLTAYYMLCHQNKEWFKLGGNTKEQLARAIELYGEATIKANQRKPIPLPEVCHLFSYALDDGVVRRDFTWKPTKKDAEEVVRLTRRWNDAYASEVMPDCTCPEHEGWKFCKYAHEFTRTKTGYELGTACCSDELIKEVAFETA